MFLLSLVNCFRHQNSRLAARHINPVVAQPRMWRSACGAVGLVALVLTELAQATTLSSTKTPTSAATTTSTQSRTAAVTPSMSSSPVTPTTSATSTRAPSSTSSPSATGTVPYFTPIQYGTYDLVSGGPLTPVILFQSSIDGSLYLQLHKVADSNIGSVGKSTCAKLIFGESKRPQTSRTSAHAPTPVADAWSVFDAWYLNLAPFSNVATQGTEDPTKPHTTPDTSIVTFWR